MCGENQYMTFANIIVDGIKIYDPRDEIYKVSHNPALVMADLAKRELIKTEWKFDKEFWNDIARLADFCDKDNNEIFVMPKMSEQFTSVSGEWFRCTVCDKANIFMMDKFCSECGVKLNWSNYK